MILLAASVILPTACGGREESGDAPPSVPSPGQDVAETYLAEMEKMADAIEAVHDEASAAEAAATIRGVKSRLEALSDEQGGEAFGADAVLAFAGHQREFIAVQRRIGNSMTRLAMANPQLLKAISSEMEGLPDVPGD